MNSGTKTTLETKQLDEILASMPDADGGDLVPLLQEIQGAYGYLPQDILMTLSKRTGIAASRIYGVATFYEQFYLEPHGKHTVRCCRGTACHVKGGPQIANTLRQHLGVEPGQTTEDMLFTFETVACLGTCFLAPVIMVNNDYYGHLSATKIKDILESYS